MKGIVRAAALTLLAYVGYAGAASAAAITCGDLNLGVREVTVDPAMTGGLCYAQNGNFNGDDFSGPLGTNYDLLLKNDTWGGGSYADGATSGSWSFDASYLGFDRLFVAFHFGGGGECDDKPNNPKGAPGATCEVDPDSFIVEITGAGNSGTWSTNWGNQWGLSNLYLIGICRSGDCKPTTVTEPATLALLGLGLAGLGFASRRRRKA